MVQNESNVTQAQRLLEWAIFLDVVLLTLDFCLRENKINEVETMKVYLKKIHDSFTENQWLKFKEELINILRRKLQKLYKETETEYNADIADKLIVDLLSQFTQGKS